MRSTTVDTTDLRGAFYKLRLHMPENNYVSDILTILKGYKPNLKPLICLLAEAVDTLERLKERPDLPQR